MKGSKTGPESRRQIANPADMPDFQCQGPNLTKLQYDNRWNRHLKLYRLVVLLQSNQLYGASFSLRSNSQKTVK